MCFRLSFSFTLKYILIFLDKFEFTSLYLFNHHQNILTLSFLEMMKVLHCSFSFVKIFIFKMKTSNINLSMCDIYSKINLNGQWYQMKNAQKEQIFMLQGAYLSSSNLEMLISYECDLISTPVHLMEQRKKNKEKVAK